MGLRLVKETKSSFLELMICPIDIRKCHLRREFGCDSGSFEQRLDGFKKTDYMERITKMNPKKE